ncbi:MAG: S9 family peptidase [Acidobacteria bacterium]|nr:S9 family peptidase [Acidobacteriota bacterium]
MEKLQRYWPLILLALCFTATNAQPKRGLQLEDLYQYKEVADANISPDGSRVAYTVTEVSADHTRNVTHIWLVNTNGGEPKRLTNDEADETTPRWSPDGKWLAYYKQDGLWIINPDEGTSQLVTRVARTNFFFNKAGESFAWAPDSKRIAFLSDPGILSKQMPSVMERLTRPLTIDEIMQLPPVTREMILKAQGKTPDDIKRLEAEAKNKTAAPASDVRVITRLQYKSRTSFSDNLQSHIFIVDVTTKQVRQLTSGNYAEHSINWSPKGEEIVFVSNHEPDPDKMNNSDLFVVNVTTGDVRQLTKTKGCEWQPVFSPNGNRIAYLATTREVTTIDSVAEDTHAWTISANGDDSHDESAEIDRRISVVRWTPNGDLVWLFTNRGKVILDVRKEGQRRFAFQNEQISGISVTQRGADLKVLSIQSRFEPSVDIRQITLYENKEIKPTPFTVLSHRNLNTLSFSEPQELKFDHEGFDMQGWLVPPLNLDEKKKYPVILYIHGGPHGMHGYSFNATVQALAAKGYGVLLINPRGSSGYGQKFADGCVNDWGGGDYRDLMRGVDVALEKFPFLDKDRMGVMGGSYGGYMTNWIVTQTDRFKAAIASASLSNLISFYSTSLYQDLIHAEFNGMPWDNYDKLWERSPLKHIKNVKTPTMLVHGEADNDVHITQAEEMFTALKMRGVDTVLIRYPREGHGIREPKHRVDNLQRVLDWFEKYLR